VSGEAAFLTFSRPYPFPPLPLRLKGTLIQRTLVSLLPVSFYFSFSEDYLFDEQRLTPPDFRVFTPTGSIVMTSFSRKTSAPCLTLPLVYDLPLSFHLPLTFLKSFLTKSHFFFLCSTHCATFVEAISCFPLIAGRDNFRSTRAGCLIPSPDCVFCHVPSPWSRHQGLTVS